MLAIVTMYIEHEGRVYKGIPGEGDCSKCTLDKGDACLSMSLGDSGCFCSDLEDIGYWEEVKWIDS